LSFARSVSWIGSDHQTSTSGQCRPLAAFCFSAYRSSNGTRACIHIGGHAPACSSLSSALGRLGTVSDPAEMGTTPTHTNRDRDHTTHASQRHRSHSRCNGVDEGTTGARSSERGATPCSQCPSLDLPAPPGHDPRSPGFVCSVFRFLSGRRLTLEEHCLMVCISDRLCLMKLLH
jgi:hypothetical protein